MGKLNSTVKFVVFNANALLFLGGVGMVMVASLLLTADFIELAKVCIFMFASASRYDFCASTTTTAVRR